MSTFKLSSKRIAKDIARDIVASIDLDGWENKTSILLCEGEKQSIDYAVYSRIYNDFVVIPVGGCTDVIKLVPIIRRIIRCYGEGYLVVGIMDRDRLSKKEITWYRETVGVFCTKLPFIENIICTPNVIEVLCLWQNRSYEEIIFYINEELMKDLTRKMRERLPVNVHIPHETSIKEVRLSLSIGVEKVVTVDNVLYTYRDKAIANIAASAFNRNGRASYYELIKSALESEYQNEILHCMAMYLPKLSM